MKNAKLAFSTKWSHFSDLIINARNSTDVCTCGMALYWISFCSEERPILTMVGFFVSQAKRRGRTTSSVEARTEMGEREKGGGNMERRERRGELLERKK